MTEFIRTEYAMNVQEVADIFGITPQAVYQKIKTGKLGTKDPDKGYLIYSPDIRKLFEDKGFSFKHQIISLQCCKGGVGKLASHIRSLFEPICTARKFSA